MVDVSMGQGERGVGVQILNTGTHTNTHAYTKLGMYAHNITKCGCTHTYEDLCIHIDTSTHVHTYSHTLVYKHFFWTLRVEAGP